MGVIRKIRVSFLYKHYIIAKSIKKPATIKIALLAIALRARYNLEDE